MKPWKRLTDGAGSEFERLLIDSARDDVPPLKARQHVAAQLGVDLARVGAGVAPTGFAPASLAGLETARAGALVKCTLIAVIGGLSAVSTMSEPETSRERITTPTPAVLAVARVPAAALIEPPTWLEHRAADNTAKPARASNPARATLQRAERPRAPAKREPASAAHLESSVSQSLPREVEQLDKVRAAVRSGRWREALRLLDAYAERFPGGALLLEATVLRVRTLARVGRFGSAASLARRALELPGSERYRSELARLIDGDSESLDKTEHRSTLEEPR